MLFELETSAWVLLAGLIAGELYLFVIRGRPIWVRAAYFALLVIVWFARLQLFEAPTVAETLYPGKFAAFLLLITFVPIAVLAIGIELVSKPRPRYVPHLVLAILAFTIALVWPTFALLTHCAANLGCL